MLALIGRRLVALIPVLILVTFGVFMLSTLVPGDPAVTIAGGASADPERIEEVRDRLNLDRPLVVRYAEWAGNVARGDLGESLYESRFTVFEEIKARVPVTGSLALGAILFAVVVGVPLGILAGMKPGGTIDRFSVTGVSFGISIPNFFLAMILITIFAVRLGWLPSIQYVRFTDSPSGWLEHLLMPAISLGMFAAASVARQVRAGLIDVMGSNYVRTAWAMGGSARVVVGKHALKNAAIPAVTVLGLQFSALLGGSVIIEQLFSLPGLGTYLLPALTSKDVPVILGVTMFFVVIHILVQLLVDISYGFLNPKVRVT